MAKQPAMTPEAFKAAHTAASDALTRQHGPRWFMNTALYVWGRCPARLVAIKVLGKSRAGRRDLRIPNAEYWPTGRIPEGIELANRMRTEPANPA